MCGIFGLINYKQNSIDRNILDKGLQKIQHRGPDGNGFYLIENFGLASCRLAIMDKSTASAQPFEKHNLVLAFNGAIYNYIELRTELETLGITFHTTGDTEVVLEAFRYWGPGCLNRFNGMWAIVIYNQTSKSVFLARDRYGIKPLYYMTGSEHFAFASEIKAFSSLAEWMPHANKEVLAQYLAYGMQDYCPQTMFKSVLQIPAAHYSEIDLSRPELRIRRYYSLPKKQLNECDVGRVIEEFSSLFKEAIRIRQECIVPVGASLSGGVDSSSIVCRASKKQKQLPTFSVVYPGTGIDESSYIEDVKSITNSRAHLLSPPLDELWTILDDIIYKQDEPFSSASVCAQHALYRSVSDTPVKVLLDGQGADELLGGYEAFLASVYHNKKGMINKGTFLFHAAQNAGLSLSKSYERYMTYQQKTNAGQTDWLRVDLQERKKSNDTNTLATSTRLLTKMGLQVLLHYADRNSMSYGIETRLPFLDFRLVDFCMSLPDNIKIRKGHRKWLLKESGKHILPASVYHRKDKIGFETPQESWMKTNRLDLVNQALGYAQQMETIVDPKRLDKKLSDSQIWRLICAGKWMNIFNIE